MYVQYSKLVLFRTKQENQKLVQNYLHYSLHLDN